MRSFDPGRQYAVYARVLTPDDPRYEELTRTAR